MHWAIQYYGVPWKPLGRDMSGFDCYGLFKHVQREHFNIDVPEIRINPIADTSGKFRAFKEHNEFNNWHEVKTPKDGDAVLMGAGNCVSHIGIFLEVDLGGILHCDDDRGVKFTPIGAVGHDGRKIKKYLRHNSK